MSLRQSLPRPIKQFVKRKLSERGFYSIRDAKGLGEHGFYAVRALGESTAIDEFRERAFSIMDRSRLQTPEDVRALKKKYEKPIFGGIAVDRLLELQAQVIDPTNILLFTGSQLARRVGVHYARYLGFRKRHCASRGDKRREDANCRLSHCGELRRPANGRHPAQSALPPVSASG